MAHRLTDNVKLQLLIGYPKRRASCKKCNDTELRRYSYWLSPDGNPRSRRYSVGPCNACRTSRYSRWISGDLEGEKVKYGVSPLGGGYTLDGERRISDEAMLNIATDYPEHGIERPIDRPSQTYPTPVWANDPVIPGVVREASDEVDEDDEL